MYFMYVKQRLAVSRPPYQSASYINHTNQGFFAVFTKFSDPTLLKIAQTIWRMLSKSVLFSFIKHKMEPRQISL